MTKQKTMQLALITIANFIADKEIDPENVEPLMAYLVNHDLKPTRENLESAHETLSAEYWKSHPTEAPQETETEFKASLEKMSCDIYKQKISTDPVFRKKVDDLK